MRLLFVHQNFPGQFLHLAPAMARAGHEVVALATREMEVALPGVRHVRYGFSEQKSPHTHPLLYRFERARNYGEQAASRAMSLKRDGFNPDVIIAHPGWGETLFLPDVWPEAAQLHYCEFHFTPYGPSQVFDPAAPFALEQAFEARLNSGLNLFALAEMDRGYAPTRWQHGQFPEDVRDRISVIHDGINARFCRPNLDAEFRLASGRVLTRRDRVVTYVARNLEPIRGFPQFMRALERLQARRPRTEIVIVGGDENGYTGPHPSGRSWREVLLDEVDLDLSHVHFVGKVPYNDYVALLQISAAHVYLTAPFVLSWSMLEAMAVGCLVIASNTEPVREVIEDGENGLLFDFFDRDQLAGRIAECLDEPEQFTPLRAKARETILARYTVARCLPKQIELVESLAAGKAWQ